MLDVQLFEQYTWLNSDKYVQIIVLRTIQGEGI